MSESKLLHIFVKDLRPTGDERYSEPQSKFFKYGCGSSVVFLEFT